jgi:glycosyltransferase involved in cell wall biosynthesis
MEASDLLISVVVPCFNEQDVVRACHARLTSILDGLGEGYEIIYVDDGSTDGTAEILRSLQSESAGRTSVLFLSRNFGHQFAVTAGLSIAKGRATVILDADLQDPPELIAEMLGAWRRGFEIVYGVRQSRTGESSWKIWTAKAFYRFMHRVADVPIPVDAGDFRLLDRRAVDALLRMPERHRFLRGMSSWIGFRQYGLNYERSQRSAGASKYEFGRMLALALDGIFSFSFLPLKLVTIAGLVSVAAASLGLVYVFAAWAWHGWADRTTVLILFAVLLIGIELLGLGGVGEYIARIYTEVKRRPLFIVRESLPASREHPEELLSRENASTEDEMTLP